MPVFLSESTWATFWARFWAQNWARPRMSIELHPRSDTVTRPSREMRAAMAAAVVGDSVYGEDPTTAKLERKVAEICGKEAGLLVPSGMRDAICRSSLTHATDGQCNNVAILYYYGFRS